MTSKMLWLIKMLSNCLLKMYKIGQTIQYWNLKSRILKRLSFYDLIQLWTFISFVRPFVRPFVHPFNCWISCSVFFALNRCQWNSLICAINICIQLVWIYDGDDYRPQGLLSFLGSAWSEKTKISLKSFSSLISADAEWVNFVFQHDIIRISRNFLTPYSKEHCTEFFVWEFINFISN